MPYGDYLPVILFAISILSCKKDTLNNKCQELKDVMISNNTEVIKNLIINFVDKLPSKKYTQQNLNNLAASIASECDFSAEVLCFSCIDTLPEESELKLSFVSPGSSIYKTIDISYTPDNNIKVVSVHD